MSEQAMCVGLGGFVCEVRIDRILGWAFVGFGRLKRVTSFRKHSERQVYLLGDLIILPLHVAFSFTISTSWDS